MDGFSLLQDQVIDRGLCVGCGTCAGVCPSQSVQFNYDLEKPELKGCCRKSCRLCLEVCPGKDIPLPQLDQMVFGRHRDLDKEPLGIFSEILKGYAIDPKVRDAGASGGAASALLVYALENKIIDCALVVSMSKEQPWRTKPMLATTKLEILKAAQSKYAVTPVNLLLREAVQRGFTKLGVVGLPCHIHAIRKMQLYGKPQNVVGRLKLALGLFCASNYSFRATEHLIIEYCNIPLEEVAQLEYRGGSHYPKDLRIITKNGKVLTVSGSQRRALFQSFRPDRCTMCWDWSAELADISIGDFFYITVERGLPAWSSIVVRTHNGDTLIKNADNLGYLKTRPIEEEVVLGNLGFEIKRHGGAYHLAQRREHGWPIPNYHYSMSYQAPFTRKIYFP